jgi:hypothetical protein
MPVQLRCVDKGHQGEMWTLDLEGEKAVVRNPAGNAAGEFAPEEAVQRFQMPSFSESIKYFGVKLDEKLWRFDVAKNDLKQIKAFINRTIVSAGPEAMQAVRNRALRDTLLGVAGVVAGIGLTVASYLEAANKPEGGRYTITYGLVLVGFILVGKGIYGFVQYSSLKQMAASAGER